MPDPINLAAIEAAVTAKVKPCPFCGQTPNIDDPGTFQDSQGTKWGALICCCEGPEVRTGYEDVSQWRPHALEAWNNRAQDAATLRMVAALRALGRIAVFADTCEAMTDSHRSIIRIRTIAEEALAGFVDEREDNTP